MVAVRENFIFYHYKRGGAKTGYCTFCGKEVPISGHPYHNKKGRCTRCRHPVMFKALGRAGYFQTDKYYAYLVQRCRDGFVVREFRADRTYRKDTLPHSEPYWHEFRRSIYDRTGELVFELSFNNDVLVSGYCMIKDTPDGKSRKQELSDTAINLLNRGELVIRSEILSDRCAFEQANGAK